MKSTVMIPVLSTFAALASAQGGLASVTLTTTPCPGVSFNAQTFTVTVNTVGNVKIDLPAVCGLALTSSSSLPIASISCQAFKDADGKETGSAVFSATKPALISTTPVGIKSVWCRNADFKGGASSLLPIVSGVSSLIPIASGVSTLPSLSAASPISVTLGVPIGVDATQTARLAVPTGSGNGTNGTNGNNYVSEGAGVGGMGGVLGAGIVVGVVALMM